MDTYEAGQQGSREEGLGTTVEEVGSGGAPPRAVAAAVVLAQAGAPGRVGGSTGGGRRGRVRGGGGGRGGRAGACGVNVDQGSWGNGTAGRGREQGVHHGHRLGASRDTMVFPGSGMRIVVATRPVDFRRQHEGLAAAVAKDPGRDPHSGIVVVFRNFNLPSASRRDRVHLYCTVTLAVAEQLSEVSDWSATSSTQPP